MATGPGLTIASNQRSHVGAVALLAALALAAIAAAPASAAAAPVPKAATFALSPDGTAGALLLRAAPGQVVRGAVLVRNVSSGTVTVSLQAADIRTAGNGNADYATTKLSAAGRWIHLAATQVRLAPQETKRIAYSVHVPVGTHNASHYAGIVGLDTAELAAAATQTKSAGGTFSFRRVNRQAIPLTIRLPGPLTRRLSLRSSSLSVLPAGAGVVLALRPGGGQLIQTTGVKLRVLRDGHLIFASTTTLGQLFPATPLDYRIPWQGTPTEGSYRLRGTITPEGATPVEIDQTVAFTREHVERFERLTPQAVSPSSQGIPGWVWAALGLAAALLAALSLTIWKLARRPRPPGPRNRVSVEAS